MNYKPRLWSAKEKEGRDLNRIKSFFAHDRTQRHGRVLFWIVWGLKHES
jgi:hypothetical protein